MSDVYSITLSTFIMILIIFSLVMASLITFVYILFKVRTNRLSVSIDNTYSELDKLLDDNTELAPLNLPTCKEIQGVFLHDTKEGEGTITTRLGLNNNLDENALLAAGTLKNYRPYVGFIVARFDGMELAISLNNTKFDYYLNDRKIGYHVIDETIDTPYDFLYNRKGQRVLWHSRPRIATAVKYTFYSNPEKTNIVAEVVRGEGRNIDTEDLEEDSDTTSIKFYSENLTKKQKSLILGFVLIDKMFMS